jgi:hypothetical protein
MSAQDSVTSMSPGVIGEGLMTGGRRRRRSGVRKSRKTRKTRGGMKYKSMNGGKRRTGRRRKTRR